VLADGKSVFGDGSVGCALTLVMEEGVMIGVGFNLLAITLGMISPPSHTSIRLGCYQQSSSSLCSQCIAADPAGKHGAEHNPL